MPSISLCFHVHLPSRLNNFSFFDLGTDTAYEDETGLNQELKERVTQSYLPANQLLLKLIEHYQGDFRCAFYISGVTMQRLAHAFPHVLDSFAQLAATGCVEFLGGPYAYSLSFIKDRELFKRQVLTHEQLLRSYFSQDATVFYQPYSLYNNYLAYLIWSMGYRGMILEPSEQYGLNWDYHYLHTPPDLPAFKLITQDVNLSHALGKYFPQAGVTASKLIEWIHAKGPDKQHVTLFTQYEYLGYFNKADTGIFDCLKHVVPAVLAEGNLAFHTPKELLDIYPGVGTQEVLDFVSNTGGMEVWQGSVLQREALDRLLALGKRINPKEDIKNLSTWNMLQDSIHLLNMSPENRHNLSIDAASRPSPEDTYINFMNILADLELKLGK